MPKRPRVMVTSEEMPTEYLQMLDDDPRLPRTPVGKRCRRTSDVIDSLGGSPTPSTSAGIFSVSASPTSGFLTPQRPPNRSLAFSPDHGYSTPEFTRTVPDHFLYKSCSSPPNFNPFETTADEHKFVFSSPELLGKMSVPKEAEAYNMDHPNRGKCVIFNHERFDMGFDAREGSKVDAKRIEQTFQRLGFQVEICEDYEYSEVTNKIAELSSEDHSDNDCLCIFVLTHGLKNDFICAKNVCYKIEHIWKPFTADRCSTLAGKPKLFFFQACRGDNLDAGVRLGGNDQTDSTSTSYKIPTHADFLFAFSTAEGFFSWRNPEEGTWYIQSLCDILDKYSETTDLVRILTMTARKVATNFASDHYDPSLHDQKQVPSITSMLIRDLFFTSKNY